MEEEQVSTNFLIFSQSFVASLLWHQRQKQVDRASPLQIWMTEFSHLYSHHLCDFTQYLPLPLNSISRRGKYATLWPGTMSFFVWGKVLPNSEATCWYFIWFYLATKCNYFPVTEDLNVQRLELNKYCHSSGLQPSSRRGGKTKNAQGRNWGVSSVCLPVCPEDLFGPQVESKLKLSKAGAATEKEMRQEMFSWSVGEDGWKEGGIKNGQHGRALQRKAVFW